MAKMAVSFAPTQPGFPVEPQPHDSTDEALYRVLVAGADEAMRASIISVLAHESNLACCGESCTLAETRDLVGKLAPDLVLLELRLPDGEGFELIGWLGRRFPHVPVLVTSEPETPATVMRALSAGAAGYLAKRSADRSLVQAIQAVLRGERFVDGGFEVMPPEALMPPASHAVMHEGI
jgi:DNA-binding NarL/FixJ family response regulator